MKPEQPFLDWLHRVDSTSTHVTLEDLILEPIIYLLPESNSKEEALKRLEEVSGQIFEEQLNGWYRGPSVWPLERGLAALQRWFECSLSVDLIDLCDDRLKTKESIDLYYRMLSNVWNKWVSGHTGLEKNLDLDLAIAQLLCSTMYRHVLQLSKVKLPEDMPARIVDSFWKAHRAEPRLAKSRRQRNFASATAPSLPTRKNTKHSET